MTGVNSTNLNSASTVDSVLGNRDGNTVQIAVELLAALIAAQVPGPQYETRATLYADLDWPANTRGVVWGDATEAYRGVYKKSGASGAGSWARIGDLPMTSVAVAALAAKAPLDSPPLTGTPTAPTPAPSSNDTSLATTAFVQTVAQIVAQAAVDALVAAAPGQLDTLNEIAAALGNDANFAATITAGLAGKAPLVSPALTGTPTVPTAAPGTNTTQVASTAFVQAAASAAVSALVAAAPGQLDTLNELAAALGNDANFAATVTAGLADKVSTATMMTETAERIAADAATDYRTRSIAEEDSDFALVAVDDDDRLGFAVTAQFELLFGRGGMISDEECDWDFVIVNENDEVLFGRRYGEVWPVSSDTDLTLATLDARNRAWSRALDEAPMLAVQLPTARYNTVAAYGQSLSRGAETWPSLSKITLPGTLMLGDNVDNVADADVYQQIGTAQLNPLVAETHVGSSNIDGAAESALTPGSGAIGEPPVIGLVRGLRIAALRRAVTEDDGRALVAISAGQGGKTIEQLSKVNAQDGVDRYGVLIDGIAKVHGLRGADTHVVTAVQWMQGEWNYRAEGGGTTKRAPYLALQHALLDDWVADIMALTGQAQPPLTIMYQTGANYTRDSDADGAMGLAIGMAQLDLIRQRDDVVLAGPIYPYTDKSGHLDANGSRWAGHLQAKVARRVLLDGRGWQPLRPLEITVSGTEILVHFHVPVPPLRWSDAYVVSTATQYAARGFRVTDAAGLGLVITSVEIVAQTIVRIRLAEAPPADALLWYGSQTGSNGNGNLADSDRATGTDRYEYVPERGMYAAADIPELVDRPYDLRNWAVAFCLPLSYSEF